MSSEAPARLCHCVPCRVAACLVILRTLRAMLDTTTGQEDDTELGDWRSEWRSEWRSDLSRVSGSTLSCPDKT